MKTFPRSAATPSVLAAVDIAKYSQQALIEVNCRRKVLKFANSRAGFDQFAHELERHKLPVEVAFEATGDYHRGLAAYLAGRGIHLHLVSSIATHRTREALYNSWDKNDPKDAQPRRARKVYHPWAVENVPGVGGHLKVYHRR